MKLARNHTPIIIDTMRTGATAVTNESAIVDRSRRLDVGGAVLPTSHRMLRLACGSVRPFAAAIITTIPRPSITQPIAILVRLVGSWPRAACQPQNDVSSGVKKKIMNGLNA